MRFARNLLTISAAMSMSAIVAQGPAIAETAAEFYKGKTITAISPAGPDATFTVFARLVAPFMEKYTGAKIVVEPMPAGGGYQARNAMFEAKPDGLTICLIGHGPKLITGGMFQLEGVRYQWDKFVPLAQIIHTDNYIMVAKDAPETKPSDFVGKKFNAGESSPFFGPQVAEMMGYDQMTVIPGFRSTASRAAAIARGEIQMTTASREVLTNHSDAVKAIAASSRDPQAPELPTFVEAAVNKKWAERLIGWIDLLNMSYAPPGLADDKAAFLEDALRKTWADPEFKAALEKLEVPYPPEFVGRDRLQKVIADLASMSPDEVKEMKFVITEKYKKK